MAVLSPTFPLNVPDVGDFLFRKRRVPDQIKIQAEASRLTGGPCEDVNLTDFALAWATLKTLTETGPEGWDMDGMDPLDADDTDKVWTVWRALRREELSFRKGA